MGEDIALGLFLLLPLLAGALVYSFARRQSRLFHPAVWVQLALGNCVILFLLLSLLLAGGEIYYRFLYDATDSLDYSKVSVRWFQRYYRQNSWGCRDNIDYENKANPYKHRVTFLGDSFTAGHGVKNVENTFPLRIRSAHPGWEIQVAARPGFDTGNELETVASFVTNRYEFGDVILVYCLNDIGDILPEANLTIQRIYEAVDRTSWLRRNSYFINTVFGRISLARNPDYNRYYEALLQGYRGPAWQKQKDRLRALRDLIHSHGGRLYVVTFPFLQLLGPNYEYRSVHKQLDQCWHELQVPHLDLLTTYERLPPAKLMVNAFDGHPNEYAHALAASAIEEFLKESQRGPSRIDN